MKTFSGTFNGQKYIGVGKPEGAKSFFIGGTCKICNSQRLYHCNEANSCGNVKPALKLFKDDNKREFLDSTELPDGDYSILGTYQTKGEIDFEVKEEWVQKYGELGYCDYNNPHIGGMSILPHVKTKEQSLLSLLDRDSRMAFPLEENPYKNTPIGTCMVPDEILFKAESQVRPKSFLIILIK